MARSLLEELPEILIQEKLITPEQMSKVVEIQKKNGSNIIELLVEKGYVDEKVLMTCIAERINIPQIDLNKIKLLSEVVELVPKQIAHYYQVIPIARLGNILSLAMVDPLNVLAIDDIKIVTGLDVQPVICSAKELRETLANFYTPRTEMEDIIGKSGLTEFKVEKGGVEEDINIDELLEKSDESSVVKVVNFMLLQAIKERASDVHIEPFEKDLRLRYRVDGVLYDSTPPPKHMQAAIVSRIKIMSNLDIAERRLPQDGRFRIKMHGREIDFRVSCLPTAFGEKIVLRVLDKSGLSSLEIDKLGFHQQGVDEFKRAISSPYGIILLTGTTGSGKSTTLYTALKKLNEPGINIVTVEDPVEYQIEGVNQVAVNPGIGLTFAAGLRSILRQDPDVVMVGEIRDLETADIAIKAALTGHLVLSTLHTNDAASAISRLSDMGIEPFLIASSTVLVAAQRLVRRICDKCRAQMRIPGDALRRAQMNLGPEEKVKFCKGKGCPSCKGTGYSGRMALIETITVDDEIRELIVRKVSSREVKLTAIRKGMKTLRMVGLEKVIEGATTLEEILRVTAPD